MLFGNKRLYNKARQAKLGNRSLPKPLEELRCWICEKYKVNALFILYDKIDIGPHEGRPRLDVVLETAEECEEMHEDRFSLKPHVKNDISRRFSEIVAASNIGDEYNTNNVHLVFDDFSDESMGQAIDVFLGNDKQGLLDELKKDNVWDVTGFSKSFIVFYLTDEDVINGESDGRNSRIKRQCYDYVKKYDEFDYFDLNAFPITFDSKENLDKNYNGSMFNYLR